MILGMTPFANPLIPSSLIIRPIVWNIPLYLTQLVFKQTYSQFILLGIEVVD